MNHKKHRTLWNRLAETGYGSKGPTLRKMGEDPINGCFACEEAGLEHDCGDEPEEIYLARLRKFCRANCPIDWSQFTEIPDYITPCEAEGTPYEKWWNSTDPDERKKLAAVIRDIPWRKK